MITNYEQINEYTEHNKIYVPTNYINQNYKYQIDSNNLTIITNNNCYNNYNTTYCDCYRYNIEYNIISESYSCNNNPSNYIVSYTQLTNDINSSKRITNDYTKDYIIMYGIVIIIILIATLFKRNSRSL